MKNRKTNFIKFGILLFGISLFLFNCEKEEVNQTIERNSILKTVSKKESLTFLNGSKLLAKGNTSNLTYDISKISFENITNSDSKIAVIPAKISESNFYSRILLLKINDTIKSVVYNMYSYPIQETAYFSGEVTLSDLNGKPLKTFKYLNGVLTNAYIVKSNYSYNNKGLNDENEACRSICGHSIAEKFCNCNMQYLEEIVISSNNNSYVPIAVLYGEDDDTGSSNVCEVNCNGWDDGGGGDNQDNTCSGGKVYNSVSGNCECAEGMIEDSYGICINSPTPCETALLSRDVYNTINGQQELGQTPIPKELSGGWELNTSLDTSTMNLTDADSGFNSAVYQKLVNGVYQYMYVTEGTSLPSVVDWYNNISQVSCNSTQYEISVDNAIKLNNLVGNNQLYFTGHSLGGGLASANSLATGRTAYTYNAAGLSYETRLLYNRGYNSEINATVVVGEIIDRVQSEFGIKAEDSDQINYIEEESTFWQDFFNERLPALNTYRSARLHTIGAVIDILDCE